MIATALEATSLVAAGPAPMALRIAELAAHPAVYESSAVRVCGWSANALERQYTVKRRGDALHGDMAVDWLPGEPKTLVRQPARRCVTGVFSAACARPAPSPTGLQTLCIGPDWTLKQTEPVTR